MIFVRFLQAIFALLWGNEKTEILNFQDFSAEKSAPRKIYAINSCPKTRVVQNQQKTKV